MVTPWCEEDGQLQPRVPQGEVVLVIVSRPVDLKGLDVSATVDLDELDRRRSDLVELQRKMGLIDGETAKTERWVPSIGSKMTPLMVECTPR